MEEGLSRVSPTQSANRTPPGTSQEPHLLSLSLPNSSRRPLRDHNSLELSTCTASMEAMPSFSSRYSQTTTPQPSCLNNKTPEPMVAYKESRNVIAGPTPFPGALDQSLPTVSNKGIEKENRMTRIKIVGPKPPTQEDYRPTPEAGFDRSHAISRTKRKDLARFGEDGQNKEGNRQAVTEAQVSTSNSSAKAPVSEFEGKDLMQLVKIPSSAKKKRSNSARSDKPARVKTGWIKNSAMEALTASTRAARHTRRVEERTPLVSLYSEEIEDDFRLITGQQPQQRPIKRPRNVQAQNKKMFPGMNFTRAKIDMKRYNGKL